MHRRHVHCLLTLALAGFGCADNFKPETLVDGLRVLGIRAEPPELRPGETALLDALMVDASRPSGRPSVLWLGCAPDPYGQGRSACSDSDLADQFNSGNVGGQSLPPGVSLIGFNQVAQYSVAQSLFDVLDANDVQRQVGTVGQVLAFAVSEDINPLAPPEELAATFERVKNKETASLLSLFRIPVREYNERNRNPEIDALIWNGEALSSSAIAAIRPGEVVSVAVRAVESSFEPYTSVLPTGVESRTERLVGAWFSTTGRFKESRVALDSEVVNHLKGPMAGDAKNPMPESPWGKLWVVVRDSRGGQTWREQPLYVCDPTGPTPALGRFLTTSSGAVQEEAVQEMTFEPADSVLQFAIDGVVLDKVPGTLAVGPHRLSILGKNCERVEMTLSVPSGP